VATLGPKEEDERTCVKQTILISQFTSGTLVIPFMMCALEDIAEPARRSISSDNRTHLLAAWLDLHRRKHERKEHWKTESQITRVLIHPRVRRLGYKAAHFKPRRNRRTASTAELRARSEKKKQPM